MAITVLYWVGLGMYTEGTDPYFGVGEIIVDFIPSLEERDDHALTIFLSLLIPATYEIYKVNKKTGLSGPDFVINWTKLRLIWFLRWCMI